MILDHVIVILYYGKMANERQRWVALVCLRQALSHFEGFLKLPENWPLH